MNYEEQRRRVWIEVLAHLTGAIGVDKIDIAVRWADNGLKEFEKRFAPIEESKIEKSWTEQADEEMTRLLKRQAEEYFSQSHDVLMEHFNKFKQSNNMETKTEYYLCHFCEKVDKCTSTGKNTTGPMGTCFQLKSGEQRKITLAHAKQELSLEQKIELRKQAMNTAMHLKPSQIHPLSYNNQVGPLNNSKYTGYNVVAEAENIYNWLIKDL